MSYNVTQSGYVSGQLHIDYDKAMLIKNQHESDIPESCCLNRLGQSGILSSPFWNGGWSGQSIEVFEKLLAHTQGEAEIYLIWEGGDDINGYHVRDGIVTKKKAKVILE